MVRKSRAGDPGGHDPEAAREARRYKNPIASREYILQVLAEVGTPLQHDELCRILGLKGEEQEALDFRLRAMERDGQLLRNRKDAYCLVAKTDLVRGRVQGHRDGYGFLIPLEGGEDLYLHSKQMDKVFDGDEVLVRISGTYRGRAEATIVEVLQRNTSQLVGRFFGANGTGFMVPDNPRISHDVIVEPGGVVAKDGQFVVVRITRQPERRLPPMGMVVEVLGDELAPGMETDVAIRSWQIPFEWSQEVLAEAERLGTEVADEHKTARIDLRDRPFVTIDGEDARDFDDAVYCESRGRGWRLWVAIADVSHYVQVDSALDGEAWLRGNSVYFPARVVPMLPEAISNGLCSLNPDVDRLCMVCEIDLDRDGAVTGYRFFEGLMRSAARLTYTQVAALLAGAENPRQQGVRQRYPHLVPHIENLHALYQVLLAARQQRGALDIESDETRMLFDDQGKIQRIIPVQRNDAHRLIEECMLCANVCAADFLQQHKLNGLYRVHEGPKPERLESLRKFLGELGLDLPGQDRPGPGDYQSVLAAAAGRPDAHVIHSMVLRSMSQAVYQAENKGHFGLHYEAYTHFTSPIRRYPDLLVHRAIRSVVRSRRRSANVLRAEGAHVMDREAIYPYTAQQLVAAGEHCSMTERRADDATRDVEAWLKCEYLSDRVGEVFPGIVSAVTGFGLFVELTDIYVEGLVHVTALANDYYQFDRDHQRLVGERTRAVWQLGDAITVQVVRVNLDERKIDLEPVGEPVHSRRIAGGRKASGGTEGKRGGKQVGKGGRRSGRRR